MEKSKKMDAMRRVVEILTPLPLDERAQVVRAAFAYLGDGAPAAPAGDGRDVGGGEHEGDLSNLPPRARVWMKQNDLSVEELQQVFHVTNEGVEVIAAHMPGKNKKEQTYNAYILTGIAVLLETGTPSFPDKRARKLCETAGCYDSANHSAHLRNRGNKFTGTKEKGWTLTAPSLKQAVAIIKEITKPA